MSFVSEPSKKKKFTVFLVLTLGVAVLILLGAVVFFPGIFRGRYPLSSRPNVLILTADTLRGDHVGWLGHKVPTTPNLDEFSKICFIFGAAYAPRGETAPSLASAFTGLYPSQHGVFDNHCLFPPGIQTLPLLASEAGYQTAAFVANKAVAPSKLARDFQVLRFTASSERAQWEDDEAAAAGAISFLRSLQRRPFLLWVHFMDPHSPYEPGPEERGIFAQGVGGIDGSRETLEAITQKGIPISKRKLRYVKALYDEEILGTDKRVGRILSEVKALGLLKNTIVVFFSDHGEELGDHHLYFFHQVSVYRQVLHVPLLWYIPGQLLQKRTEPRTIPRIPVSLVDIAPTIASFIGVSFSSKIDGRDLRPLFEGKNFFRKEVMAEYGTKITSVITQRYHAIYNPERFSPYGGPFPSPEERRRDPRLARIPRFVVKERELYDILEDPLEQEDIAQIELSQWKELSKSIFAFRKTHPFRRPLRVGSQAALRVLADLGYIQGPKKERKSKGKNSKRK